MRGLEDGSAISLIEQFQLAAFGLQTWEVPLSMVASAARAKIGQLAILDNCGAMVANICTGVSDADVVAYETNGGPDPTVNLRTRAVMEAPALRCISEADFTTPDELKRDPFYNDFFIPRDLPFSCLSKLFHDDQGTAGLALLMSGERGHLDTKTRNYLSQVMPRIAEVVRGNLCLARMQNTTLAALASQSHGTFILLGKNLRIQHLSHAADRLLRHGAHLSSRGGRLCCTNLHSHAALERAMADIVAPTDPGRRLRARLRVDDATLSTAVDIELVALPPPSHDGLLNARAVLVVHDVAIAAAPAWDKLRARYSLTGAEAEICALLLAGENPRRIAERRGSSVGTVRNQIKVALEKTSTHRQVELVLLIREYLR